MQRSGATPQQVADAQKGNWVDSYAPNWLKPYARLARWDRPVPLLLLFWPCAMGLGLAAVARPELGYDFLAVLLFLIGSVAMRGAGCTLNDIADADIDAKVARTRSRPLPSGQVKKRGAFIFLGLQCLVGLAVLTYFNAVTIWLSIASLGLVVIYPFMKRVTWWPQFFLGLAFNWGALIGWSSATGDVGAPALTLYVAGILWTIGYDTIYALQDVEDDALIGVKSTARLFGRRTRIIVAGFYTATLLLWGVAGWEAGAGPVFYFGLVPVGLLLVWQVWTLHPKEPRSALVRFRSNHWVGLLLTLALLVDHWL
jgi:4-hydroxybenzoate polyprenyltransferase